MWFWEKIKDKVAGSQKKVANISNAEILNNRKPKKNLADDIPTINPSVKDNGPESLSAAPSATKSVPDNDGLSKNSSAESSTAQSQDDVKENTLSEKGSEHSVSDNMEKVSDESAESEPQNSENVNKDSGESKSDSSDLNQNDTTNVSSNDTHTDSSKETEKEVRSNPATSPAENSTVQSKNDGNDKEADEDLKNDSELKVDSNPGDDADNPSSIDSGSNSEENNDSDDKESTNNSAESESNVDTSSQDGDDFPEATGESNNDNQFEEMEMCPLTDDMWGEKDGRYYLGEPLGSFEQIPYFAKKIDENQYHKNDLIADIAQFNNLLVMGVSLKGEFHYANKVLRQDSFAMENLDVGSKRYLICAVADGVGSAPFSDQLSDLLVNQIIKGLKERLTNQNNLHYIDWDELSEYVWKISLKFSQINSTNQISDINEFSRKWASTLELIVIDYNSETSNRFAHVTICGDGGAYLLRNNRWLIIKRGKETKNGLISNDVVALPHRPLNPIVKYGYLKNDEALIMVTDGLGDIIERSIEFRSYLFNRIIDVRSLPEFIKTISTSVNQMDDDKTCIVIKHKEINNE